MLGSWCDTLREYYSEFQAVKPLWSQQNKDIRENLNEKRKAEKKYTQAHKVPEVSIKKEEDLPEDAEILEVKIKNKPLLLHNHKEDSHTRPYRGRGRGCGRRTQPQNMSTSLYNKNGQFYANLG